MVQGIKDVTGLAVAVIELGDGVLDGVGLSDLFQLISVAKKVKPAVDAIKSGKVLTEYKNLSQSEKDELTSWFDSELDIKDNEIEKVIEQVWKVVLDLNDLANLIKT